MRILVFVALACTSACGKRPIGEYCTVNDECAQNLSCVQTGGHEIINGQLGCNTMKRLCSKPCSSDADCASLGSGLICLTDCAAGSCVVGSH